MQPLLAPQLGTNHHIEPVPGPQNSLSLNLQQLKIKTNQAMDPHLSESHTFTQIVNKSI